MSRATLADVLAPALAGHRAVAALVVLGWDDAVAFVEAAEQVNRPIILQAGPGFRKAMPVPVIAAMFNTLAEQASVPVVSHLDHATDFETCRLALDHGFTSVMFDGSMKPLNQNIDETAHVVEMTRRFGASCEGEIGYVGYADGADGRPTDPEEAGRFVRETGVDAVAISVGNVHLQQDHAARIDWDALKAIEAATGIPLVLHGGSGIPPEERRQLARHSNVCKFNIGTELRMTHGRALRAALDADPALFDRLAIARQVHPAIIAEAARIIRELAEPDQAG